MTGKSQGRRRRRDGKRAIYLFPDEMVAQCLICKSEWSIVPKPGWWKCSKGCNAERELIFGDNLDKL